MPKEKNYITFDGNSLMMGNKSVTNQKETSVFKGVSFVEKIKTYISWVSWLMTYILMYVTQIFLRVEASYEDSDFLNVRRPMILVSNHKRIPDPWHITFAFPFKIFFGRIFPLRVYTAVLFSEDNFLIKILRSLGLIRLAYFIYNSIPIPATGSFEQKISPLINSINKGESVLMFPEGRLVSDESILEFKKGALKVHALTEAPILPIALKYEKMVFPFYKVYINVGKPMSIPEELLKKNFDDDLLEAREYLREKIINLYKKI